jgi:hypothetical protein
MRSFPVPYHKAHQLKMVVPFEPNFISFIDDVGDHQEFEISNSNGQWLRIQSNSSKVIRSLKKSMFKRTKFRKYQSIKQMVETLELGGN